MKQRQEPSSKCPRVNTQVRGIYRKLCRHTGPAKKSENATAANVLHADTERHDRVSASEELDDAFLEASKACLSCILRTAYQNVSHTAGKPEPS